MDGAIRNIKNNQRKISRKSAFLAVTLLVVFIFTLHNDSFLFGWWALSLISVFLSVALIVISFIFRNRAKKMDQLLSGEKLIARWELSPDQRHEYALTLKMNAIQKNKAILWVVFVLFILIIIPFLFFLEGDEIAGFLIIMGGICLIAFIASRVLPQFYFYSNMRGDRQILIGKKYAYINGYFHNWDYLLSGLKTIKSVRKPFPGILIRYYYTDRTWRNEHTLVIPTEPGINTEDLIRKITE